MGQIALCESMSPAGAGFGSRARERPAVLPETNRRPARKALVPSNGALTLLRRYLNDSLAQSGEIAL